MAGFGEAARGSDRASKIMKYEGLPENGKPIVEEYKRPSEVSTIGTFVSTMNVSGASINPVSLTSEFGDSVQKPRFMAKIKIFDEHSDDNF